MIIDISRELFSAKPYPGDPLPEVDYFSRIEKGDLYNISILQLPLHAATHVEAPKHIIDDGKTIDQIDLSVFNGECRVAAFREEIITGADIENLRLRGQYTRLLIKGSGKCRLSKSAAYVLIDEGIQLVGIDSETIGTESDDYEVHRILFLYGTVILEGLDLNNVSPKNYELTCLPLKIKGAEASPCRAFLKHVDI